MTSRLRDRRRSSTTRAPGIWRGAMTASVAAERTAIQHGIQRWGFGGWRLLSGIIVISLSGLLVLFFVADFFYVHSIAVGGLKYLTRAEVFALSNIADTHVFWIDPDEVRRNLLRSPTIADATVHVGWPPVMVSIVVQEREPALIWEQAGVVTWVDIQGRVMALQEDRPDLVRIFSDVDDGPIGQNVAVGLDIVSGALQLKTLIPEITVLRYNPINGLGYQDPRGWMAWFGTGTDMAEKIAIYKTLVDNVLSRGIQPVEINVSNPDAPYRR